MTVKRYEIGYDTCIFWLDLSSRLHYKDMPYCLKSSLEHDSYISLIETPCQSCDICKFVKGLLGSQHGNDKSEIEKLLPVRDSCISSKETLLELRGTCKSLKDLHEKLDDIYKSLEEKHE